MEKGHPLIRGEKSKNRRRSCGFKKKRKKQDKKVSQRKLKRKHYFFAGKVVGFLGRFLQTWVAKKKANGEGRYQLRTANETNLENIHPNA